MVGISAGAMNYVLKALVERGYIKLGNFASSKDRRRYAYILTRKGMSEKIRLANRFLARKLEEYDALNAEIRALRSDAIDKSSS